MPAEHPRGTVNGHLLEVFRSWQGEGPYAGVRQIFVRLAGCHLRCHYCDTPESWERAKTWSLEGETRANPASVEEVAGILRDWSARERFHSVSFTGGEPVLQPDFLRALAIEARAAGLPVYLDTSGTLAERLAKVADAIDIFALDYKLPSTPGVRFDEEDVRRCLAIARGRGFVKIVTTAGAKIEEIDRAAEMVADTDLAMPVVIQVATAANASVTPPDGSLLARARAALERHGLPVYVLPQIHALAGWK
ncbi:MAG: 7-carboxy-7-deazaguanine synthase QueE [Planctomycetes bacterium]|nr:7-carboxy-7-deazaguanine synthase QueE [Planctomycetota bacterium]